MTQNKPDERNVALRQKAEAEFRKSEAETKALSSDETSHFLHELQVHQIELEMQNDELRRTQAELDAARERYFDLYNLAPVGYLTISEQGLILEANLTAASLLGLARGALVKKPISRFIFKDDQDRYYLYRKQLFKTGKPQTYELRMKKNDGMVFWAHLMTTAAQADDGKFVGRVVLSDITERKQAEEALNTIHNELERRVHERTQELANANRELLSEIAERKEIERQMGIQTAAIEAAANGILITDLQGNIRWANPAMTQISGYKVHELIGQNIAIFTSGMHSADFYSQWWNSILSGQVWHGEITNRRKDGSLYVEEQTVTPVRGEDGLILYFIIIKQDITERRQAHMELEQQNRQLQVLTMAEQEQRQFAEALAKAAIILNKSLRLDEVLAHILGEIKDVISYQLATVTLLDGDTFYDASYEGKLGWSVNIPSASHFSLKDFPLFTKIIRTGQPVVIPDTRKEADWVDINRLEWSLSFLSAPLLVEGQVIGFVNLFADQPDFFSGKMCEQLVAFAAHAAVAIHNARLFEQVRVGIERLHSLSQRLVEIQENERRYISRELHDEAGQSLTSLMVDLHLLDKKASQPEVVKKMIAEMDAALSQVLENLHRMAMALRPATLDHLGLVPALTQHIESIQGKHGIKISFSAGNIQKRLPENVETVLYRIVQEALTNVVRHAHATRIDVVLTERDGKLIVIVEDDGVGFDPNLEIGAEHLGLFGVRERVEMIGGKLVLESSPGKGTTLVVEVNHADALESHG